MKNSISARVGRILTGSITTLIDKMELMAPEAVMHSALSEVDLVLREIRAELGLKESEKYILERTLERAKKELSDIKAQIEIAIAQSKDELAEAGVSHMIDLEAQISPMEESLKKISTKLEELSGYVTAILAKKRRMKEELKIYREGAKKKDPDSVESKNFIVKLEQAEEAFDNVTPLLSNPEDLKEKEKLNKLADLARADLIKNRLEKIKADRIKE